MSQTHSLGGPEGARQLTLAGRRQQTHQTNGTGMHASAQYAPLAHCSGEIDRTQKMTLYNFRRGTSGPKVQKQKAERQPS